ncbi:endoplasmic reticulum metallopeptidase 1-like isoform X2 [Galleria mellonella]|uniref:Endoplasmic reticulum metallopeptidase 1-like isoform X2 n=1 Tax=Galleria mellonella TaxID=7137 RepID=A0ABM3MDY1_GALME|nr:endoplasmic reticulum metallopeptidase 1-like isoform X2 [Galleria mellonella]
MEDINGKKQENGMFGSKNGTPEYVDVPSRDHDKDRDEKPWQRVVYEVTRKGTHLYEPVKSIPSTIIIVVLGVYLLLGYFTQLIEDNMPTPYQDADITRESSDIFSEESAWRYLYTILGDEPRVAGTEYHLNKTRDLKNMLDQIAAQSRIPIRTDWQFVTGSYLMNSSTPFLNYYHNLSNVVAVLEGESGFNSDGSTRSSILVNCHYDSVPFALGASDNVVFCAVMAETLEKMSRRARPYRHNIVFLFNGAEENPLQASHGFLQHSWSRGATVVVNLDAAGMNGKPAVFQATDLRLLRAFRRVVPRPNAQSFGEYLFQSGVIPSDTDFRIWRDFGNISGIDIAYSKWGHVYHTRYDHPSLVREGVVQCAGDMLLPLLTELADLQDLENKVEPSGAVYYDFLNLSVIAYSKPAAHAIDALIALLALLSVAYYAWLVGPRWTTVQELLYAVLGRIAAMLAGVLAVLIFVPLMVVTTIQMRYLSYPWLVVPLYWMPYLVPAVIVSHLYDRWRTSKSGLNRSIRALQAMAATRLLLGAVLVVLTCVPSLTTVRYALSFPLMFMSCAAIVSLTVVRYFRMKAWRHLVLEVALSLPGTMFAFSLVLRADAMVLPVMGRSGLDRPDYLIAAVNLALAALTCSTVSGIELLFSRRRLWITAGFVSLVCLVLMFIPFSPYSDDGPSTQRHYWFHSEIKSHDINGAVTASTTGVLVTKHDPYSSDRVLPALRDHGISLHSRTDFSEDCQRYVFCNLPLYRVSFGQYLKDALFLYTSGPAPFDPEPGIRVVGRDCLGETCTLQLNMTAAPHNMVTVWPRAGARLAAWSLAPRLQATGDVAGRPYYVMVHSEATYKGSLDTLAFNLTLVVPLSMQNGPLVDVSHHAHKIHHPKDYTTQFAELLDAMPKYFNFANFMTFRNNYVF